jgi:SH3 domain-containing YSC84-like protein 1
MQYTKTSQTRSPSTRKLLPCLLALAMVGACARTTTTAVGRSSDARAADDLVEQSRMTLDNFLSDREMGDAVRSLLKRAKAVQIYPQILKGAFVLGAAGGSGVALARDPENRWGGPAFYTIGEMSFGFQAGGEAKEVLLVALTDRGLSALQATSAKLGVDAGVAVGPVGIGAAAATQNLSADIVSYVRSKGLYAGVSVDGAVVATRTALNQAYYGRAVTPADILVRQAVSNPQAANLIGEVKRLATS